MESVVYAVAAKDGSTRYGFVLAPAKIESPRVEAFRIKAEDRSWVGSLATEARKGTYQISGEFRKEDPGFLY
ncbi:MAG: hypothetical protein Q7S03_04290 [bacterium]|nr:hypothetical protein [bacterium]